MTDPKKTSCCVVISTDPGASAPDTGACCAEPEQASDRKTATVQVCCAPAKDAGKRAENCCPEQAASSDACERKDDCC